MFTNIGGDGAGGGKETPVKVRRGKMIAGDRAEIELEGPEAERKALDRAAGYISHSFRTERQVRDYLRDKGYSDAIIEYCIEKLKHYGYVDDEKYAEEFIRIYHLNKGTVRLKAELLRKGIARAVIEDKLSHDLQQGEIVENLAQSYMKGKELNQKNKARLFRYLYGRGFSYDDIKAAMERIFSDDEVI